jgi:hypothetical protein
MIFVFRDECEEWMSIESTGEEGDPKDDGEGTQVEFSQ